MKFSTDYYAGVLETHGGFYLAHIRKPYQNKRYIAFKIVTKNHDLIGKMCEFLQEKHKITLWCHKANDSLSFYTTKKVMIKRLTYFMLCHCQRRDFIDVIQRYDEVNG